jgi:hypothetical protein
MTSMKLEDDGLTTSVQEQIKSVLRYMPPEFVELRKGGILF